MYICETLGIKLGVLQELFSPRLQDRPAALFHLVFPVGQSGEELLTIFCATASLPRHRLPVASSLTQPQIASSALKSGL